MMTKCQAQAAEAAATMEMVMFIAQHLTHRFVYGSVSLGMTLPDKCYRRRSLGWALTSRRSGWCPHPLRRGPA